MAIDHLLHNPDILAVLCGAGAFAVVVLIWTALVENDPLPARLKNISARRDELRHQERNKKLSRRAGLSRADFIKNLGQRLKLEQGKQIGHIRLKLARAGYRSRDAVLLYLLLRIALPTGAGLAAFFLIFVAQIFTMPALGKIAAVIAAVGIAFSAPDIFLKNASQKREALLRKGMPDALDLLVICAEAGLSLDAALDRVSREIGPSCAELAEEIGLTGVELGFLPDRSKALQNLADRVPLPGVVALVNTLVQTEKYGTPLAQALRVLSAEMREERMMAAEAKAAKLPATLTIPMIVFILPPLFVVLLGPAILRVMSFFRH